jgi:hypothetical protein
MDKLTHMSITNCIKEIDALEKLALSERFSYQQIADWLTEISWNLANVFRRRRYDSDEFQHRLKKLIKEKKQEEHKLKREESEEDKGDG